MIDSHVTVSEILYFEDIDGDHFPLSGLRAIARHKNAYASADKGRILKIRACKPNYLQSISP